MEEKWHRWEEHSAKAKEEEEQRKLAAEKERQKRMEKREKIFRILQARDEGMLITTLLHCVHGHWVSDQLLIPTTSP